MSKARKTVRARSLITPGIVAFVLVLPVTNASAAGIFDFLFGGGGSRPAPSTPAPFAPLVRAFTDPSGRTSESPRRESSGGSTAYCVRLCDGHPFPVHSKFIGDAACSSMCHATPPGCLPEAASTARFHQTSATPISPTPHLSQRARRQLYVQRQDSRWFGAR